MKKVLHITIAALFVIAATSCNDLVLNLENSQSLDDEAIWSSETSADNYITASYKTFSDVSQVAESRTKYFDSFSDIMKSTSWDQYNHGYNSTLLSLNGFRTGSAGSLECWDEVYTRIRRANVLLVDMDRYAEGRFDEDWCKVRRAEVRFCRAFSYYRLIRVYGGVILRTHNSGVNGGVDDGSYEEDIHRARMTEAESWQFVLDELQWAAQYLPERWPDSGLGRATKSSAYALMTRIAVHAQQWQVAIDAAEQVYKLGSALAPDYAKVFQVDSDQDNSSELLFALYYLPTTVSHSYDSRNRPVGDTEVYGVSVYAEHVPTGELADMYEFSDGTDFSWSTWSGTHSDPFTDREPRFHATVMFNGCQWESRTIETFDNGTDSFVEFTQSGSTNGHTCTGYYLRKYLQEGSNFVEYGSYQYNAVLRYAEVLLNKAEAYAELDYARYQNEALGALNEVRARVGLPGRTATDAPTRDAFMALLRKERCVELAGEGLRYWDLRRWKLAESVIHGQNAHGVKISDDGAGNYTYEIVECDGGTTRIFLESYYYPSLPTQELSNNKLAVNNPYW